MECPSCKGELRFLHSYEAGDAGRAIERECQSCGRKHSFVELHFCEIDKRGTGAYALAQRLKRGELDLTPEENESNG